MGAKRQYRADFLIGAKLIGSFRGTMVAAQARLKGLQRVAIAASRAIKTIAVSFGALGAIFAGFGLFKMISSLFSGAAEDAEALHQRTAAMLADLLQFNSVRKKGLEYAQEIQKNIRAEEKRLEETTGVSERLYDIMARIMLASGVPARQTKAALGPMGDLLIKARGVAATEQDAAEFATAYGKAIHGKTKGLQKFFIFIDPKSGKVKKSFEEILEEVVKIGKVAGTAGFAKKQMFGTDEGTIQRMRTHVGHLRDEIGDKMLPIQAKLAEGWLKALPVITPAILSGLDMLFNAIKNIGAWIQDVVVPQWHRFVKFIQSPPMQAAIHELEASFAYLGSQVMPLLKQAWQDLKDMGFDKWLKTVVIYYIKLIAFEFRQLADFARDLKKPVHLFLKMLNWEFKMMGKLVSAVADASERVMKAWQNPPVSVPAWQRQHVKSAGVPGAAAALPPTPTTPKGVPGAGRGSAGVRQSDVDQAREALGLGPGFAIGGIVRRLTPALLGERGAEAVIPLSGGPRAQRLLSYANTALGRSSGVTAVHFAPSIVINGNATESDQRALETKLRSVARQFVEDFKHAQLHERRLSYEGGYS